MELLETKHCNYESKRVKFVVASFEVPSKPLEKVHPKKEGRLHRNLFRNKAR